MSLFSTLNTGVSGLNASQTAVSTTSHNIANANNEYYTRQRVVFAASTPFHDMPGDIGTGVSVTSIVRIHDEFVYSRLKSTANAVSYDAYSKQTLEEVAQYFPDLQDVGIANDLANYYAAWNAFSSNASEGAQKIALVQTASTLSSDIQTSRSTLRTLQDSLNDQLKTNLDEVNGLGQKIADLNAQISNIESIPTNNANDLRDQRDELELTLSKLLDFSVFKGQITSDNSIDANMTSQGIDYYLNIAGNSFVDGATFHPLVIHNTSNQSNYYSIYSESQDGRQYNMTEKIQGGKIGAMLDLRGRILDSNVNSGYPQDGTIQGYIDDLDTFAQSLITETNNIYAQSAKTSMQSPPLQDVNSDTSLKNAYSNLQEGTFDVIVYNNNGQEVARKSITINNSTTMNDSTYSKSILEQINTSTDDNADNNSMNDVDDYFTASFSDGGVFSLMFKDSLQGYKIALEDHGTNFPGTIGVSQFFSGSDGSNIDVKSEYKTDPSLIQGYSAPVSGNNNVANAMVQMQYDKLNFYRKNGTTATESVEGFYRFVTTRIASDGEKSNSSYDSNTALYNTVYTEFQSISGVNTDEELANLMKFQSAYGANAKVIATIGQMLDTLLGIKA
ncbi:MAG: flagellar hook-associated protein FlgK [Sulfurospirillaceae bacterium]|nr:flagellar hook-associated protein FlgK [Sulfurospirillaceae bacterium]MDD2826228.1 flagellar hook-associated protein FlgK [Sulfurospirillaceae bacterium]